jgi:muconate cycloisomerase
MIAAATLHALAIPFRQRFRHAAAERAACDSVVVHLAGADGTEGWGEGAPRPHVTGETVDTVLADLAAAWPEVAAAPWPPLSGPGDLARLPLPPDLRGAARAALELAMVDLLLRRDGRSLAYLLPPRREAVRYSGVVGATSPERARGIAEVFRAYRVAEVKVKVGFPGDVDAVRAVRAALGPRASIRVDANGAWRPAEALPAIAALAALGVDAVEQPLPWGAAAELAALRARSPLPLVADESLLTVDDARELAAAGAVDRFNLRVSKCGGLGPCLAIAAVAAEAGIGIQVGCQAGETAILSAAGRHLAAAVDPLVHAEGSFGEALLVEDVGRVPVLFGTGGEAPVLTGPGLGIEVDAERVRRWTRRTVELGGGR